MLMLLVTSFELIGVFAVDDSADASAAITAQEGESQTEPPAEPDAPGALTGLRAVAGSKAVILKWVAATPASGYKVSVNGGAYIDVGNVLEYSVKGLDPYTAYNFAVLPYTKSADGSVVKDGAAVGVAGQPVRNMTIRVKIKKGGTLKSHGGPKQKLKLKKGQTLEVDRFGGGKYIFSHNGSTFYCNLTRTGKKKAVYTRKFNYSREDAEAFVNGRGMSSKTNHLVWVSTYCQHMYIFSKGADGRWVCYNDWECATGKPKTPSPTGVSGNKTIWKKIKNRHNTPWWSPYSDINSIHGKRGGWTFGKPTSNGCIRNPNAKAKIVYYDAKIGTRVLIY